MRILTYKRTHKGDPDNRGVFGINDCMGAIRNRKFDAVVGIGSKAPWDHIGGSAPQFKEKYPNSDASGAVK